MRSRRSVLALGLALTATGCVQVFGLDELSGDDDPGVTVAHTAQWQEYRLSHTVEGSAARVLSGGRFWIADSTDASGFLRLDADLVGEAATADFPDVPYLVELRIDGEPPVLVASDDRAVTYVTRRYGRQDIMPVPAEALTAVDLSLMLSTQPVSGDAIVLDTFGVWTSALTQQFAGVGSAAEPLTTTFLWEPVLARPPGAPFGLWSASDLLVLSHRVNRDATAWLVADAVALTGTPQQVPRTVLNSTLTALTATDRDIVGAIEPLTARISATPASPTGCVERVSARMVVGADVGNLAGVVLGASLLDGATTNFRYGAMSAPTDFALRFVTGVTCDVTLGGTTVQAVAEQAWRPDATVRADVDMPFVTEIAVNGVTLTNPTNAIPATNGSITIGWRTEAGRPAPDLYRIELLALGGEKPVVSWRALAEASPLVLPREFFSSATSYALTVAAVDGHPSFATGDATPTGDVSVTITPSRPFILP